MNKRRHRRWRVLTLSLVRVAFPPSTSLAWNCRVSSFTRAVASVMLEEVCCLLSLFGSAWKSRDEVPRFLRSLNELLSISILHEYNQASSFHTSSNILQRAYSE